jgi:hypothetical protein
MDHIIMNLTVCFPELLKIRLYEPKNNHNGC